MRVTRIMKPPLFFTECTIPYNCSHHNLLGSESSCIGLVILENLLDFHEGGGGYNQNYLVITTVFQGISQSSDERQERAISC